VLLTFDQLRLPDCPVQSPDELGILVYRLGQLTFCLKNPLFGNLWGLIDIVTLKLAEKARKSPKINGLRRGG